MSENEFKNYDFGKVIYDVSNGMYYSALNTFKKTAKRCKSLS